MFPLPADDELVWDCGLHGWLCTGCPEGRRVPFKEASERTRRGIMGEPVMRVEPWPKVESAVTRIRQQERSEIVAQLERLWGMSGGTDFREGITEAIREIRKRDGTQEIRDRGLAKEGDRDAIGP